MNLRGASGAQDSPSSVSLNGLAGLDAGQGSLTSNALFGSLNLEELLSSREMEQQGRELLHSMRAADAFQKSHRSGDGGALQPHPAGPPPPPEFGGFPRPESTSHPGGKTSDDIWRGLGMDLAGPGAWPGSAPPAADMRQHGNGSAQQPGDAPNPSMPPALGGYLSSGNSLRSLSAGAGGGAAGTMLPPQHQQHHNHQQQHPAGRDPRDPLGTGTPSLASSISGVPSTGLTQGVGGLGVFSSGSTEVASHLMSAGGSAWYSQLGLQPSMLGGGGVPRSGSGLPSGLGGMQNGGASALQSAQNAIQNAAGSLAPGGSSLSSYGSMGGMALSAGGGGSHPGTPTLGGSTLSSEAGSRRAAAGAYPGMGSPRFSSHTPLPAAGTLYRAEVAPQGGPQGTGPGGSPPRYSDSREASLSPPHGDYVSGRGAVPLGAMLPPPNLVIHSGGGPPLQRGISANGRMQAAPRSPPEVDALQQSASAARRMQQRSLSQPAGRGNAAAAAAAAAAAQPASTGRGGRGAAAFPDIPTTVPRVRAEPVDDDDFDLRSEMREASGRSMRSKSGKGRGLSEKEKEQRDLKRKEANRESAARSRDKRLKLIADLEVEVQQLKRQHAEFKAKVIENTVPRPSVEALEERKRALRRVRTDPADCEAHIAHALLSEGLDLEALAAQVQQQVGQADEAAAAVSGDDGGVSQMSPEAIVAAKLAAIKAQEKAEAAAKAGASEGRDPDGSPDARAAGSPAVKPEPSAAAEEAAAASMAPGELGADLKAADGAAAVAAAADAVMEEAGRELRAAGVLGPLLDPVPEAADP